MPKVAPTMLALAVAVALVPARAASAQRTWNMRHIANAELRPAVEAACRRAGYAGPVIATPDAPMGGWQDRRPAGPRA